MSIPQPPTELEGHCSTIYDDTLYVLSPNSFLSLPLQEHAQWSKESTGVPVTGPACVTVAPEGDASQSALYVIGGTTNNDSYGGLQRYSFGSKSWETLSAPVEVLQGRTNHGAAYLSDSQSILIYAGSQPSAPSYLSSQTFLISTQSPYNIQAYTSEAPPGNLPILQPWNSSTAVMVGGSDLNTDVWTFDPTNGWLAFGTNLTSAPGSSVHGVIIDGSDGSRVLELYDTSVSPNNVTQVVLLDAGGGTAATGQPIGSSSSRKRKRDLTLQDWPKYNSTNAPTATRSDCSVAQGTNGVAVIAGGNSDVPVAMFNQDDNSWIDADKFFDSRQQPLQGSASSSVSASTPTTSSSGSNTPAPLASGTSAHNRMMRTLGITLGTLCGIAAVFILVLLFLRWRKAKQRKKEGYLDEKTGERMSFADRGASFMKEAGGSVNGLNPPNKAWNDSQNNSHSSLAIITGKFGNKRATDGHARQHSYESTARLVKDKDGTTVMSEPVEMVNIEKQLPVQRKPVPHTAPRETTLAPSVAEISSRPSTAHSMSSTEMRKRSSGWSKYFATSLPTGPNGLSHLPSAYAKHNAVSDGSAYSTDPIPSQISRIPSSALVPPLDIDFSKTFDGQRLSHVTMRSPSFNDSREDLAKRGSVIAPEGQRGLIVDPSRRRSNSDTISSYNRSTLSSNMTSDLYNESGHTPWTPMSATFKDHVNSRPTSSMYTNSIYEQRIPSRGRGGGGGFFPGAGTNYRPSKAKMSHSAAPSSDWASPKAGPGANMQQADDRDSTVTVFPKGVPSAYYADRRKEQEPPSRAKPVNSDLGWLNLGLSNSQTRI